VLRFPGAPPASPLPRLHTGHVLLVSLALSASLFLASFAAWTMARGKLRGGEKRKRKGKA